MGGLLHRSPVPLVTSCTMRGSYCTSAWLMDRDTVACCTPWVALRAFSTAVEHEAQCMPRTRRLAACSR